MAKPMDRRGVLLTGVAALLGACINRGNLARVRTGHRERLDRLMGVTAKGGRVLAGAGLIVRQKDRPDYILTGGYAGGMSRDEQRAGAPLRPFLATTKLRIASVSKLVVTLTALRLAKAGLVNLDRDLRRDWPLLRHPGFPDAPVTLAMLLSHHSSRADADTYWIAAPGHLNEILRSSPLLPHRPGSWFEYSNLNYAIAAGVLEHASGRRFDQLARAEVLKPLGLKAGFNWSGVDADHRRAGATLYRLRGYNWEIQADGPEYLTGDEPAILADDDFVLDTYQPGTNGSLFSPQGGLRASLQDMANLARAIADEPRLIEVSWQHRTHPANGNSSDGLFYQAGLGTFMWPANHSPLPGLAMVGHDGEAYGLYTGAWAIPDLGAEVAYAITGTPYGPSPPGRHHPAYNFWVENLFAMAGEVLAER